MKHLIDTQDEAYTEDQIVKEIACIQAMVLSANLPRETRYNLSANMDIAMMLLGMEMPQYIHRKSLIN